MSEAAQAAALHTGQLQWALPCDMYGVAGVTVLGGAAFFRRRLGFDLIVARISASRLKITPRSVMVLTCLARRGGCKTSGIIVKSVGFISSRGFSNANTLLGDLRQGRELSWIDVWFTSIIESVTGSKPGVG